MTKEQKLAFIREKAAERYSTGEVARMLRVSRNTIAGLAARNKITFHSKVNNAVARARRMPKAERNGGLRNIPVMVPAPHVMVPESFKRFGVFNSRTGRKAMSLADRRSSQARFLFLRDETYRVIAVLRASHAPRLGPQ